MMTGEDKMSTMAISKNTTKVMNTVKTTTRKTWTKRFKEYILDNAGYFAAASTMMTGNSYGAAQIMKNTRF